MNRLEFCYFQDYENGKMARLLTTGDYVIPVNISIDNDSELEDVTQGYRVMDYYQRRYTEQRQEDSFSEYTL